MSFLKSLEIPALDYAGKTFTFALTSNINFVTSFKNICFDDVAYVVSICVFKSKFFKNFL